MAGCCPLGIRHLSSLVDWGEQSGTAGVYVELLSHDPVSAVRGSQSADMRSMASPDVPGNKHYPAITISAKTGVYQLNITNTPKYKNKIRMTLNRKHGTEFVFNAYIYSLLMN